jgi:ATP-dependent helicase HrpA
MPNPTAGTPTVGELLARLPTLSLRDEHRLRGRLRSGRSRPGPEQLQKIAADIARAEVRIENRRTATPDISYPAELPITARREDLLAALTDNQVLIVAGETGSGKTTQLPKLCLELGRGVRGLIGHTQPRRIAARAVAQRLAEELKTEVGGAVGFAVRFSDQVGDTSLVKLMTDGILLAEIGRDRMLRNYDTIIIDEAHERSLNIDFLLGYLRTLLPRRPDLKLIITSATIDPQRFAAYFNNAPIIEVSGRGYPVDIWYRPVVDPDDLTADPDRDQISAICDAVTELARQPMGDVLVFLSGEREIRDTADALSAINLTETEILPLYARLSAGEQHRVFAAHRGRRIVLSTNVAETSLTVPGIKYVIDAGTARISRYSNRTKVQLLPIEDISQASAAQRAGRCGRTSPGICIRLYSEDDFDARPAFTDPEILRTNLASVMLQMACLDLGPIADFGFIDPPDKRQISDGLALLAELGAFTGEHLTPLGRKLAQLPLDPRLARMLLEAENRGCVADVLVLTAALSIADPRERPVEHQQKADALHARFTDPTSDFASYLNLWRHIREQQRELSSNQFRKLCRTEFLNYLRIREWQDLSTQLRQIVKGMGIAIGEETANAPDLAQIHRSLLSGLLSHIGLKEGPRGDYLGARGAKFAIFPGSGLFKKQPQFVMAAELVETSRLWGRVVAGIDAEWAEEFAGELAKRTYSEPHWERRRASAVAIERVTLYGVPLVTGRKVGYQNIDPQLSRELFIRHALVEGDWDSRHHFLRHNRDLVTELQELEERARRRDILVHDDTVFAFYDSRIPAEVVSAQHFDQWWKKARHADPELLDLKADDLINDRASGVDAEDYPSTWSSGDFAVNLSYRFEPGVHSDGVTVTIPLALLGDASAAGLDWQVPGLRSELVTALLRGLAKPLRRSVVPIPDTAAELIARLPATLNGTTAALSTVLSNELRTLRGVWVTEQDWNLDALPEHLKPTYRIVSADNDELASGKDLAALQKRFAADVRQTLVQATSEIARDNVPSWDFDELPRTVRVEVGGHIMTGYPALVDENGTVALRVQTTEADQRAAMRTGTRRLLRKTLPTQGKQLRNGLRTAQKLALSQAPHGSAAALIDDCVDAALDLLIGQADGPVWNRAAFQALATQIGGQLPEATSQIFQIALGVLADTGPVRLKFGNPPPALKATYAEVSTQLDRLVYPGFVTGTGAHRLADLRRYLRAMAQRLQDAPTNLARDRERQAQLSVLEAEYAELRHAGRAQPEALAEIGWMIEELRVSVFAQRLGTPRPVSVARIHAAMDALEK